MGLYEHASGRYCIFVHPGVRLALRSAQGAKMETQSVVSVGPRRRKAVIHGRELLFASHSTPKTKQTSFAHPQSLDQKQTFG
jgi:hypothetical protein